MNFIYDNRAIRTLRLKEWDFYQINCGDFVVQIVIGNVSYAAQVSATVLNLKTGQRKSLSKLTFNTRKIKKAMPSNPEKPCVLQWFDPEIKAQFEVANGYRRLTLSQWDKTRGARGNRRDAHQRRLFQGKNGYRHSYGKGLVSQLQGKLLCGKRLLPHRGRGSKRRQRLRSVGLGTGHMAVQAQLVWGNGSTVVDANFSASISAGASEIPPPPRKICFSTTTRRTSWAKSGR